MVARWVMVLAMLAPLPASAGGHWIRLRSANFEMYSSAGETGARGTLQYFEQVHAFFSQAFGGVEWRAEPVCIIDFSNSKEFEPYRLNGFANAYSSAGSGRDFIVLSHSEADYFETVVHEYVHVLASRAKLNLPVWLNEGIADLYSTLRPLGDSVLIGAPLRNRLFSIRHESWVPLSIILAAGHDSPYYSEKSKASALYSEGWALAHMLMLGSQYKAKFPQFLDAIQHGQPSEKALAETYAKPVAQIERELIAYLEARDFRGATVPIRFEKQNAEVTVEPAPAFDLKLRLAELMNREGNHAQSRQTLEALAVEEPDRPEPYAALGYLKWRDGDRDAAARDFERAFENGSRDARLLWDFGRIAAWASPDQAERAFMRLLEDHPERNDARFELAFLKLRKLDFQAAIETVRPIENAPAEDKAKLFEIVAYAELGRGHHDEARRAAMDLARVARQTPDRMEAALILSFLESKSPASTPSIPVVVGSLVEIDCVVKRANLIVETAAGRKMFLADNPVELAMTDESWRMLPCGAQSATKVRIEYTPSSIQGLDGVVRRIQFEP